MRIERANDSEQSCIWVQTFCELVNLSKFVCELGEPEMMFEPVTQFVAMSIPNFRCAVPVTCEGCGKRVSRTIVVAQKKKRRAHKHRARLIRDDQNRIIRVLEPPLELLAVPALLRV